MDYIIDIDDTIYDTLSDEQRLIYDTHIYIVNNMGYKNNINYNIIYNYDEISDRQYFNIMSFLDEIS
jgi:hypothetical protein